MKTCHVEAGAQEDFYFTPLKYGGRSGSPGVSGLGQMWESDVARPCDLPEAHPFIKQTDAELGRPCGSSWGSFAEWQLTALRSSASAEGRHGSNDQTTPVSDTRCSIPILLQGRTLCSSCWLSLGIILAPVLVSESTRNQTQQTEQQTLPGSPACCHLPQVSGPSEPFLPLPRPGGPAEGTGKGRYRR